MMYNINKTLINCIITAIKWKATAYGRKITDIRTDCGPI